MKSEGCCHRTMGPPAQRKSSQVKEHHLSISKPGSKDGKFQGKVFIMRYCSIKLALFWLGQVIDVQET